VTRRAGEAILIAICAAYAVFCVATRPAGPLTSPDSAVYLAFSPVVPAGYPAFLRAIGERGAVVAQPLIYAAALAALGIETLTATASLLLAAAVVVASIAVPEIRMYHASIQTESLFMSALLSFLAAAIRFARTSSLSSAAAAAMLAGLATTLRTTGFAFLPVLVAMVLLERRRLAGPVWRGLIAATLPMLALAAGERAAARVIHGDRLTSLAGRHLYAKAALIDAPPSSRPAADPLRAQLDDQLTGTFAPIRSAIDAAPREVRPVLTLYYEGCLQGRCVPQLGETQAGSEDPALAAALAEVGRARIIRAPVGFISLTATNYASLWTVYKQRHPDTAPALNAWMAANRPLPFERQAFGLGRDDVPAFQPLAAVRVLQPIVLALGAVTGILAFVGLAAGVAGRRLPLPLTVACVAALTAHSGLIFSATFAAGIARFMVAFWPAVTTSALFAGYAAAAGRLPPPSADALQ